MSDWQLYQVIRLLQQINWKVNIIMSEQADIDAQTAAINTAVTNLTTADQAIEALIQSLEDQGVDTTSLD